MAVQPRYDASLNAQQDIPSEKFETVWLLPGKDLAETQYLLAHAVTAAKKGGVVVAAASNNAGGKRLRSLFETLGLSPSEESKNHARVNFAHVNDFDKHKTAEWISQGQEQKILYGDLLSRPGLHSWDRPDAGSEVLAQYLPQGLHGSVADFGCGWGYLSLEALKRSKKINRLTLVDIDARAISIANKNIGSKAAVETLWTDLSPPHVRLGPFDAILLNPPFHDGTRSTPELGQAIIATAARSLRPTGIVYLVANQHLPYEKGLRSLFSRIDVLTEEKGFKAFTCRL